MAGEMLKKSGITEAELLHPSKYVRKEDLKGRDVAVTIRDVEAGHKLKMQGGKEDSKPVLHFEETDKLMVLNKENKSVIVELYTNKVANWIGKRITLWADPSVSFGGRRVGGLRIRPKVPPAKGAAPAPASNSDPTDAANEALRAELAAKRADAESRRAAEAGADTAGVDAEEGAGF